MATNGNALQTGNEQEISQAEKVTYLKSSHIWGQINQVKNTLENELTDTKLQQIMANIRGSVQTSVQGVAQLEAKGTRLTKEVIMALYGIEKLVEAGLATVEEDIGIVKSWASDLEMRNDPKRVFQIAATLRDIFRSVKIVEASE